MQYWSLGRCCMRTARLSVSYGTGLMGGKHRFIWNMSSPCSNVVIFGHVIGFGVPSGTFDFTKGMRIWGQTFSLCFSER